MFSVPISFTPDSPELKQKAEKLAEESPFLLTDFTSFPGDLLLLYTEKGLGLHEFQGRRRLLKEVLRVDFLTGTSAFRLMTGNTIKQPLARAAGLRQGIRPRIFDATAGLGQDAFVLASLGCDVTLCERNPLPAALLADGLDRAARSHSPAGTIVREKMTLLRGESGAVLRHQVVAGSRFDTIYFDPMFPHGTSSAQNKKAMRLLRGHVGDDEDAAFFVDAALPLLTPGSRDRVTVKRPAKAPLVCDREPQYRVEGKSCRYDVYLAEGVKGA